MLLQGLWAANFGERTMYHLFAKAGAFFAVLFAISLAPIYASGAPAGVAVFAGPSIEQTARSTIHLSPTERVAPVGKLIVVADKWDKKFKSGFGKMPKRMKMKQNKRRFKAKRFKPNKKFKKRRKVRRYANSPRYKKKKFKNKRYKKSFKKKYKRKAKRRYKRSRRRNPNYRYFYRNWYYTYPWWLDDYYDYSGYVGYGQAHIRWCLNRYRTYNVRTNRFIGRGGYAHQCVSPYYNPYYDY